MGETLDNLRAKYPQYDEIPSRELASQILAKYPQYKGTDLEQDAAEPKQGVIGWLKNKATGVANSLAESLKPAPPMEDEAGNVTGKGMFQTGPVGTAMDIGQKEGTLAGVAELSKWALPGRVPGMVGERPNLGPKPVPEKPPIVAGPGPAYEAGPAGQAGRLGEQLALPPGPAPSRGTLLEQGQRAASVGEEAYKPRPTRPTSVDADPYAITPEETPGLLPKPGPANEVAPSALDVANRRAPLTPAEEAVALPQRPGLVTPTGQDVGTVGRTFLNNRGSIDPNLAFLAARTATGAVAGAAMGDNGIDSVRYGVMGAALGAAADPRVIKGAASMWRESPLLANTSNFALWASKFKAKAGAAFLPEDIARGIAPATNIVREAYAATDAQHLLEKGFLKNLRSIYEPIAQDEAAVQNVHRALDGQPTVLNQQQAQVAQQVRAAFDDMANKAGLPQQGRIADYFPHLRDEVTSSLKLELKSGGTTNFTKEIPQDYKVFFQQPRTAQTSAGVDFGMGPVEAYAKAAAKRIAMKGGTDLEGNALPGFLNRVGQHLEALPEVPELQNYFKQYVNDLVKGPERTGVNLLTPQQASTIKHAEFLRTIGMNLMSPVVNLMQTLNTFAVTDMRSWGAAWYDMARNPSLVDLAKKSGVVTQDLTKADLMSLANPDKLNAILQKGSEAGGYLFGKAEQVNRLHAFLAGYRDAGRAGLTGADAMNYAKDIVNRTQFRFGMENLPQWMRGGNPTASVLGQFKSYQMNQTQFLRELVTKNPVGAIKYAIGTSLLAGPDAMTGSTLGNSIREHIASAFGGDPKDYKFRGALGEMGIYLGQQLGMGALPAENLSSLFFLLPGPALSHIMDIASVVSGRNLNPTALADGTFGKKLTAEQFASKATSNVNVQANRLRQAGVLAQTEGDIQRQPRNLTEAFALSPPTGAAGRKLESGAAPLKALGVPSQAAAEYGETKQRLGQDIKDYHDLVNKKALAIRAGDIEEVKRLNQLGVRQFGRIPVTNMSTMKRAAEQTTVPGIERDVRHAPRPIRGYIRKESEQ